MAIVKVGIIGLSVPDKIQYARQLVIGMTGNPNFATPLPSLATVTQRADSLETAYNDAQTARQTARAKTAAQDTASAELDLIISQLGNYVQNASDGDSDVIMTSGFAVRAQPIPIGELPAPANLSAQSSQTMERAADLAWDSPRGSRSFIIERAPDGPELVWSQAGVSTRPKATVNSMTSGNKYWFRVAAVGAAGLSPWSDPVPLIVA